MANARDELLENLIKKTEVKCAKILNTDDCNTKDKIQIKLKVGYTPTDWLKFLNNLNFDYDEGYGGQELFGIILFKDGSWLERYEYDGSESWVHKYCADIPIDLIK